MIVSIITWVNNPDQYKKMMNSFWSAFRICNFEFIKIWKEAKSMAEAYAMWQKIATWDILIYCHQDIEIRDLNFEDWMYKFYEDTHQHMWFAGIIWSTVMTNWNWWDTTYDNYKWFIIQGNYKNTGKDHLESIWYYEWPAWILDACLLVTRKNDWNWPVWELPWIHFLDSWMCHESQNMWLYNYIFPSLVYHASQWTIDESYYENKKIFQKHFDLI